MRVHINRRINAARLSAQLYKLHIQLHRFRLLNERRYGKGIILPTDWALSASRRFLYTVGGHDAAEEYATYVLPLQIHTELNGDIDVRKLESILPSDGDARS